MKLVHDGGEVRCMPGMYAMGLPVLRRRRSTFISGAAADSHDLACHLPRNLDRKTGQRISPAAAGCSEGDASRPPR